MPDPKYQRRMGSRTRRKVELLLSVCPEAKNYLDVGCNSGRLAAALLKKYPESRAIGIDVDRSISASLEEDARFFFVMSDITKLTTWPSSDVTFCLSVMHHVLAMEGKETFNRLISQMLNHCKTLFFEMGMPSESGKHLYWLHEVRRHFPYDGEVISYFQKHPFDLNVEEVGSLPFHGSSRPILRIQAR